MATVELTFVALNERIEALPEHPSYRIAPTRRKKWGYALATVAGTLGLALGKALPPEPWAMLLLLALLAIEIGGLLVAVAADVRGLNLTFADQRREYAESLDFDMPHYEDIVAWLQSFPRKRLQAMGDFTAHRIERFRSKLPLLTGGIDRLGALPVLAALVVQFKDMRWPPHPSWTQLLLFGGLMGFYWLCMLVLGQRFRLELYDALLRKALETRASPPAPAA